MTGDTNSSNFPLANAYQSTLAGANCGSGIPCSNAFITKLDPTGTALVYSTYLGGNGSFFKGFGDIGNGIAVDALGNAYVAGASASDNFPMLNPLPDISGCPCPNFVAKLSPAGALLYSTPLAADTDVRSIVVDASGSAYVTGEADSDAFPTTDGAFQTHLKGSTAGFFTKIGDQAAP